MGLRQRLMEAAYQSGLLDAFHRVGGERRLTVLAYHRIDDPHAPGFDTFKPNVSATPAAFAAQMDFVRRRFNVVSEREVVGWLRGGDTLPAHPLLITFDDGYRDNLLNALPILRERGLPAVVFLATDYVGSDTPFNWDLAAYCFHHTAQSEADLPTIGHQSWNGEQSREAVMNRLLAALKTLPDAESRVAYQALPQALGVDVPGDAFAGAHLTWDEVREMAAAGVAMGGHTQSHPILTRISAAQARVEVAGSKARVEAELGRLVTSFAYPNGTPADFNPTVEAIVREAGFAAAYTLLPGPARFAEAQAAPLTIRRVFVGHRDTLPRFAAKVVGLARVFSSIA
jgi:peptidoglycan/xylan/chitin deacetylase (PgdA/CDA1 family)